MSTSILSGLMEMRNMIDTILEGGGVNPATVKSSKKGKTGKESKRKGKPTPHGDFTKLICEKFKDEVAAFKAANPDQKGAHLVYVSTYKKDHADEYKSFEAEWKATHSDSEATSDAEVPVSNDETKPKRTMSDEQKAKMKAGREAAAAKKALAASETSVTPQNPVPTEVPVPAEVPVVATPSTKKPVKVAKKSSA